MRLTRILYAIVTVIVASSLFISGLAEWQDSGTEEGIRYTGYVQRIPVVSVCYILGAVGVIYLGWYQLRLTGAVTSIAALLHDEKEDGICRCKRFGWTKTNELCQAFKRHFTDCTSRINEYEKKIRDLQVKIQL